MSAYSTTGERVASISEFERLPDDGRRSELVRGRVVREPPAGFEHGGNGMEIGRVVANFVKRNRLGRAFTAETGFVLSEEPPTVRAPDVAFVAADRLPAETPRGFVPFAPDLAVEVVSPSNTMAEIQAKVFDYLDAGTRLVWVVEPKTRTITVYRSREEIRILSGDDTLDGGEVLPGFRVGVGELFAG